MRVRLFFITYGAAGLGIIAYGLLALLNPDILLDSFSRHVYRFPIATADYLSALFRLLGFFNLVLGVFGLILLRQYGIRRQTWILQVAIACPFLAYLGPIIFDNTVGNIGAFEIVEHILFAAMILSGVTMLSQRESF